MDWLKYFQFNRTQRMTIPWQRGVQVEAHLREPLIASLQRFQVGETGEGRHLKKCAAQHAAQTGDASYIEAIDMFIKEEQEHARLLAQVLDDLGAPLLDGHWSDACFVVIRRVSGLQLELMILLIAELIAKRYYRAIYEGTKDEVLRVLCAQILRDEMAHVAFHCDTLERVFASRPAPVCRLLRAAWKVLYRVVCLIVAWDHRTLLRASNVSLGQWWHGCDQVFEQAAAQIFTATPRKSVARADRKRSLLIIE